MYTSDDHTALKSILLYQSVLEYLKHREQVDNMNAHEIDSFYLIIKECFKTAASYTGAIDDLKLGCEQILNSKPQIMLFYPTLEEDLK